MSKGGIGFFEHRQTVASDTWIVQHNLGFKPIIEVSAFDGGILKKAYPENVVHDNDNRVTITWSTPRTGFVTAATITVAAV